MGLFNPAQMAQINAVAEKSRACIEQTPTSSSTSSKKMNSELNEISKKVIDYFKDSPAILINNKSDLHDYVSKIIDCGYAGIDTETTGLDRIKDTIVGASLYCPGEPECYIPSKHLVPIFDVPYNDQLSYEDIGEELQRIADSDTKLIFANADFDLSMIYKDLKVDLIKNCYYDVIIAWRCLKEDEKDNTLKGLYNKYVLKGKGDPMKFRDFFSPKLFPYCKPEVAKLYGANDAKITYELFKWQLPYLIKDNKKCKNSGLEAISDLVWGVEFPLMAVCQKMHRYGVYVDKSVADMLHKKYIPMQQAELSKLQSMVQEVLDNPKYHTRAKRPFARASDFNPDSVPHVQYVCYDLLQLNAGKGGRGTGKEILGTFDHPIPNQILKCRSLTVLIGTFVEKLPKSVAPDGKIHCQFKQIGAATGRFSSAEPNMQNIPSKSNDIRHMFRASPGYVLLSSDYSAQEPRITAYVSQDEKMIQSFKDGKDIYGSIASVAFGIPYEQCLEFLPDGTYSPEGKARRSEAKLIVLGICYGRSVVTIADQLYSHENISDEEKVKKAQKVFDSVMNAFPALRKLMINAQSCARHKGYVETILGRRRHIPDMQLPEFEFRPMPGYVNPDIDPLDVSTLDNKESIPERVVKQLEKELKSYKYFGQIAKRIKELAENDKIKVINNRARITEASRQCVNCVDYDTEILTTSGWKKYNEVQIGDDILSYSLDTHKIVRDTIQAVHIYPGSRSAVSFDSPTFSAISTMDHRWVVGEYDEVPRIKQTRDIYSHKWPDYPILRIADNSFEPNPNISDDELKVLGWIMTDGNIGGPHYAIHLYQSVKRQKNKEVYADMISTLKSASIEVTDRCKDGYYHEIYLKQNTFTKWVWDTFPDRVLSFEFISTLSQNQAKVLMTAMLQGDGAGVDGRGEPLPNSRVSLFCKGEANRDIFQYLCYVAGYATNSIKIDGSTLDYPSNHIQYDSMTNIPVSNNIYYDVTVLKIQRAQIYPHHKSLVEVDGVWCVTSGQGTWIARRQGKVYITGNSIVQGSAADQTKLAMLLIENDEEWNRLGGRIILPVHDELIAEAPIENYEACAKRLSELMCQAANFLPFESKCDVTITYRWYGMEYPCKYPEPKSLDNLSEDEIKWVQYFLFENGYDLPIFKDENGKKPEGDAGLGVNGIMTDECKSFIDDYCNRYNITHDKFIKHIYLKSHTGLIPDPDKL